MDTSNSPSAKSPKMDIEELPKDLAAAPEVGVGVVEGGGDSAPPPPPFPNPQSPPPLAPPKAVEEQQLLMPAQNPQNVLVAASPEERWLQLRARELEPGVRLSEHEYLELLLGHLIQNRTIEAKFCWMRARDKYPRGERHGGVRMLWEQIGLPMSRGNLGQALRAARVFQPSVKKLQPFVGELVNRLVAAQLALVARCYRQVSVGTLVQELALPTSDLIPLLQNCGWPPVNAEGFVSPPPAPEQNNEAVLIVALIDPAFGPFLPSGGTQKQSEKHKPSPRDIPSLVGAVSGGISGGGDLFGGGDVEEELRSLVHLSSFFDGQCRHPAGKSGGKASSNTAGN